MATQPLGSAGAAPATFPSLPEEQPAAAPPSPAPAPPATAWQALNSLRNSGTPLAPPPAEMQALAQRAGQSEFPKDPYLAGLATRYFLKGMAVAPLTPPELAQLTAARQFPSAPSSPQAELAAERALDAAPTVAVDAPSAKVAPYRAAIRDYMGHERTEIQAAGLRQKTGNRSFALFHEGAAPRGLVVMLHGFSAGTEQWSPQAQELFKEGYDVFVPALPGHGLVGANGQDDTSRVPDMEHWKEWTAFDDRIYDLAKSSGKVTLVGLSCGAMLALQIAEKHGHDHLHGQPVIRNVVAASPYLAIQGNNQTLGPITLSGETAAKGILDVDRLLPPLADRLAQGAPVVFQPIPPVIPNYGFHEIDRDQVLGMTKAADETREHVGKLASAHTPVQFIISAADAEADPNVNLAFAKHLGTPSEQMLFFPANQQVPHALVNPFENPDPKSWAQVNDFIVSRLTK